jgi:mannosyltransferase OCH1-like enzyme
MKWIKISPNIVESRRMPRLMRVCMNVARAGIVLVCVSVTLFTFQLLWKPPDVDPQPLSQVKLPVASERRHVIKDAVFDAQALRDADPSRDKVLQVGAHNPFLPDDDAAPPRRHPIIPHILHQMWDSDDSLPGRFVPWVQTWGKHQPGVGAGGGNTGPGVAAGWEHWIWTPRAVRCLLERHYPDHASLFSEYPDDISRADVMRYFVLHRYGGVYADLDAESLKPVDPWTYHHQCILSEEPLEHSFLVREANRSNVVNSPMLCRPRHPFFAQVIDALPEFAGKYFGDFIRSTGPLFLDAVYQRYLGESHPHPRDPQDNVTVVPSRYFLPTYDPSQTGIVDNKCDIRTMDQLPPLQKEVCSRLLARYYKNEAYPDSFMDHHWLHVNTMDPGWKERDTVPWAQVVPKAKKMSFIECDSERA